MLELEKWGEKIPKHVAMFAQNFATGSAAIFKFLTSVKNRRRPEGYFELPHVNKWLEFYSGDYTIIDYLISKWREDEENLESDDNGFEKIVDDLMALRKGDKLIPFKQPAWKDRC